MKQVEEIKILEEYKDVLTSKELMEILKVSRSTMYQLLHNGTIPSWKIGTDYRILKTDVINYFAIA